MPATSTPLLKGAAQNKLAAYHPPMDEGLVTADSGQGSFPATLHISGPVPKRRGRQVTLTTNPLAKGATTMAIEMAPLPEAEYIQDLCAELGYDRDDIVVLWEDGLVYIVRKQQQLYETRIRRPLIDDRENEKIRVLLRNFHRRAVDTD